MRETTKTKLDYLVETKSLIKSALIEKGQQVANGDDFRSYADKILAISGGSGGGGALPLGYQLKEIVPETTLIFAVGDSSYIPNTPVAVLASATDVTNVDVIGNGESGLVVWDGVLYAVYAGSRTSPNIQFSWGATTMTVSGAVGNIGIPSKWMAGTVVADTQKYGKSDEPFLILANTSAGFVVAIPEDSTNLTHTLQMFKFVK